MKLFFVFVFGILSVYAGTVPDSQHEQTSNVADRFHYFVENNILKTARVVEEGAKTVIHVIRNYFAPSDNSYDVHYGINAQDENGYTQLMQDIMQGEIVFAGLVLGYGANPDIQQNKTDQTALMMAAKSPSEAKSEDMINILMKHHADVNIIDKNNDTALSLALRNGYQRVAMLLIKHGASLREFEGLSKSAVLGCMAKNATFESDFAYLQHLYKDIQIESDFKEGLKDAIEKDDTKTVEMLIKNCAIDLSKIESPWPLHMASSSGSKEMINILLHHGANIRSQDSYGNTPLSWAAFSGRDTIIEHLIWNGAEINAKNKKGYSPLHIACREGQTKVVKALIENDVDVNVKSNKGNTPLMFAAFFNHSDIVLILINNGAQIDLRNNAGTTAHTFAQQKGHTSIAKMLRFES